MNKTLRTKSSNNRIGGLLMIMTLVVLMMTANSAITAQTFKNELIGTWVGVDKPKNKITFAADEFTSLEDGTEHKVKYTRVSNDEIRLELNGRMFQIKTTFEGEVLTWKSDNQPPIKFRRESSGSTVNEAQLTADVSAQENFGIQGFGRVMLIDNATEFSANEGDVIATRISKGNGDDGVKKGVEYYSLEVRQGNKTMYISYTINSDVKDKINNKNVTVTRARSIENWKTEDTVEIATRRISGGRTEVRLVKGGKGFFEFIVKSTDNSIGMEFVKIPAGSFQMGSPTSEPNRGEDEGPQRKVTISKDFYMGKTEVTQEQYEKVMGSNPSSFTGCPKCPVEMVSWDDAQEFIKKLNAKNDGVYRLPTEAEWEYAARAGTTGAYAGSLDAMAWYNSNSGDKTHEVATKQPNAWGLFDMHGNVEEWTSDWFGDYASGTAIDPTGPTSGGYREFRGGSYWHQADSLRSADRNGVHAGIRYSSLGFRLVRN